jgi:hypothetical protein
LFIPYFDFVFVKLREGEVKSISSSIVITDKKVDLYEEANRIINTTLNMANGNIKTKFFLSEGIDIHFINLSECRTT